MRTVTMGILACALAGAAPAMAQQPQGPMGGPGMGGPGMGGPGMGQQGMMGQYGYGGIDRNSDGYISQEEVREHQQLLDRVHSNWEQADRNNDGQVDVGEFAAFEQQLRQQ